MPNKMWERVKLPRNYEKALEVIDKHLMYWPKFLVHKTKQRLTKMTQMRIRMRKLALKTREKLMTMPRKETKRESRREEKAEKAAVLDKAIEKELLERLTKGVYGDIYNYPVTEFNDILDKYNKEEVASEDELEHEIEYVEDLEGLEEEDDMEDFDGLAIGENSEDDNEDEDDEEAVAIHTKRGRASLSHKKLHKDASRDKSKKKAKVHVEVEHEESGGRQTSVQ